MESRSKLYNALGAILAVSLIGCLETEESGQVVADNSPHEPIFVATFDHEPSEEEVAERLAQFGQQHDGKLNVQPPSGATPPSEGQKLIRLDVWTSDISGAGTNDANRVTFVGTWQNDSLLQFGESFSLDHPDLNDLNRNAVSVYFYLLSVRQLPANQILRMDRFLSGVVVNASTDAWHCNLVAMREQNFMGLSRTQTLPFNQWVDFPSVPVSTPSSASSPAWLTYF